LIERECCPVDWLQRVVAVGRSRARRQEVTGTE